MTTLNYWMTPNLDERIKDHSIDFKIKYNKTKFKKLSFFESAKDSAYKIANNYSNLYVAFSGGLDSDFIVTLLHELKIPFKPIIVNSNYNKLERSYAFFKCKKINLSPIVIDCTEELYFNIYKKDIFSKFNGVGINAVPLLIAGYYCQKNNGTLISGEHIIDDSDSIDLVSINEWDFYQDYIFNKTIGLLNYTPEIVYSIVNSYDKTPTQEFKTKLFNLDFRPKFKNVFSEELNYKINELNSKRKCNPITSINLGNKKEFLQMMDSWNNEKVDI